MGKQLVTLNEIDKQLTTLNERLVTLEIVSERTFRIRPQDGGAYFEITVTDKDKFEEVMGWVSQDPESVYEIHYSDQSELKIIKRSKYELAIARAWRWLAHARSRPRTIRAD